MTATPINPRNGVLSCALRCIFCLAKQCECTSFRLRQGPHESAQSIKLTQLATNFLHAIHAKTIMTAYCSFNVPVSRSSAAAAEDTMLSTLYKQILSCKTATSERDDFLEEQAMEDGTTPFQTPFLAIAFIAKCFTHLKQHHHVLLVRKPPASCI